MTAPGTRQVVAQEQPRPRWFWAGPLLGLVALSLSTVSMVQGCSGQVLFVAWFAVLVSVMVVDLLLPAARRQAVLADDALRVGRW